MRLVLFAAALAAVLAGCGAEPQAPAEPRAPRPAELVLAGDGELWTVDVASGRARHRKVEQLTPGDPMRSSSAASRARRSGSPRSAR